LKHGGDILSYQHLYEGEIIDFSSNINPLGYPKILDEAIITRMDSLKVYPDIQYRVLRQEIAAYLGCGPDEVIVGNGSVEILDHFCKNYERVVICCPSFAEYIERPQIYHKPVITIRLEHDFKMSARLLENILKTDDLIILGNPNNPTGRRIEKEELIKIQTLAEENGGFLLLDEAFFEFCPDDYDSIPLFYGKENVCIIRAATKFFGLPGIRLGYAYASRNITKMYHEVALPWRINAIADLAGRVIFKDIEYIRNTKEYVRQQRQFMLSELRKIGGITVYDTDTNFILLKLLSCNEDELFDRLIRKGLLIRKASSFEGLDKTYIRVAIKDREKNARLINALKENLP
jgi:threonine-phosphate decarboxylase